MQVRHRLVFSSRPLPALEDARMKWGVWKLYQHGTQALRKGDSFHERVMFTDTLTDTTEETARKALCGLKKFIW